MFAYLRSRILSFFSSKMKTFSAIAISVALQKEEEEKTLLSELNRPWLLKIVRYQQLFVFIPEHLQR